MLVQIAFEEWLNESENQKGYVGYALCSRCSTSLGPITREELTKVVCSIDSDDLLCNDCKLLERLPWREFKKAEAVSLFRLFKVDNLKSLPISAAHVWYSLEHNVFVQLLPIEGWCLWFPEPDGRMRLRAIRMSHEKCERLKILFDLSPACLKKFKNPSIK